MKSRYPLDSSLEDDIREYIAYISRCTGRTLTPGTIDYERFLDIEHYLGLRGSKTWSPRGNKSQLMVRTEIARILHDCLPGDIPLAYRRFVRQLTPTDMILTFNYDTLLEAALEKERVPFRLSPRPAGQRSEELVVLKLHGSIDWFDRSFWDEQPEGLQPRPNVQARPVVDKSDWDNDPMTRIYRVPELTQIIDCMPYSTTPLLMTPSTEKLLYINPIVNSWDGLSRHGALNLSLGIVGYSLPEYDDYARQVIYRLANNFTESNPDLEIMGRRKTKIRIIDRENDELCDSYQFLDWERTEVRTDGFNCETVDWLLETEDDDS